MSSSCLYAGEVVHIRRKPARHRLAYRVFMMLLDLEELPRLDRRSRLFAYNRTGLVSFHDRDHGDGSGRPLTQQVEQAVASAGLPVPGGPIRLLCMPRLFGYVFNPLSVYFCHDASGELRAIVHEVNNTFGERHFYVLEASTGEDGLVRQNCAKQFRVSPFLPQDLDYRFTIAPPDERTSVHIAVGRDGGELLSAWFAGKRSAFSSRALLGQWLKHPAMTFKVILGIHWEALFLWRKLRAAS